ncbi:DNA polymerase IV [uncultured Paludibacter sp.]|nr:DNA polymerase IV [uncultured Paludibacter sp.]
MVRKILHIDMDAFFASVEQRDNPDLCGKPIAVGFGGKRGVVAAASYEARKYGVRSAMASSTAKRNCPHLIFVLPRFEVYKEVSFQIRQIFLEYTDKVEPLSLDEAFLDVTENHKNMLSATMIAKEIKQKILEQTQLTASAGVSYNKFLAKIASDYNKPNGLYVIPPEKGERFVEQLNIERFFGVGKVTAQKMHELGIHTGADLKQWSEQDLKRLFGKAGSEYYLYARAIDNREVINQRIRKSLGAERTFQNDLFETEDLLYELDNIAKEVATRAGKRTFAAKTLTLKIKYADFIVITRSKTIAEVIKGYEQIFDIGKELLSHVEDIETRKIRLMGLTLKISEQEEILPSSLPLQLSFDFGEGF